MTMPRRSPLRRPRQRRAPRRRGCTRGRVQPIYVSVGLAWEAAERDDRRAPARDDAFGGRVAPLVVADGRHARRLPAGALGDRGNAAGVSHARRGRVSARPQHRAARQGGDVLRDRRHRRIVIGTLAHNPFPDATPAFRDGDAPARCTLGLGRPIAIDAPYAGISKADVIRRGRRARRADSNCRCRA